MTVPLPFDQVTLTFDHALLELCPLPVTRVISRGLLKEGLCRINTLKALHYSCCPWVLWSHLQLREERKWGWGLFALTPTLTRAIQVTNLRQISNRPECGAFPGLHPQSSAGPISYICFVASFNTRPDLSPSSRSKWVLHHHRYFKLSMSVIELFTQTSSAPTFPVCVDGTPPLWSWLPETWESSETWLAFIDVLLCP